MLKPRNEAADYHIEVLNSLSDVDCATWNALLAQTNSPTPFMRHEWLGAMVDSGCASPATGWQFLALALWQEGQLVAAVPLFLKAHSYGEYVFDWAWADAYQRHGLDYYPKLIGATPFTPVPGSRLLAKDDAARRVLLRAIQSLARSHGWSSAHLLFLDTAEQACAREEGWLIRVAVQFHWQNRREAAFASWSEFLDTLQRDKRKKIQQEQKKVAAAGVAFEALEGTAISKADWDFFYRCYTLTYQAHHASPYLSRDFFGQVHRDLTNHCLMFVAWLGHGSERRRIGCSLVIVDRAQGIAWGRYWGATETVPCLHFAACYYQPLQWCIEQGLQRFEGGAQGEHKMARGLLPVSTSSAHWLAHPEFNRAVEDFLAREAAGIDHYLDDLRARSPLRRDEPPG